MSFVTEGEGEGPQKKAAWDLVLGLNRKARAATLPAPFLRWGTVIQNRQVHFPDDRCSHALPLIRLLAATRHTPSIMVLSAPWSLRTSGTSFVIRKPRSENVFQWSALTRWPSLADEGGRNAVCDGTEWVPWQPRFSIGCAGDRRREVRMARLRRRDGQ